MKFSGQLCHCHGEGGVAVPAQSSSGHARPSAAAERTPIFTKNMNPGGAVVGSTPAPGLPGGSACSQQHHEDARLVAAGTAP